ncbi:MAG: hypothetical protein ACAH22_14370 [Tardiphaga sp.]
MNVEIAPGAAEPVADRRQRLLASAMRALNAALAGENILKTTADGVFLLSEVMQLGGPELQEAQVNAVGATLQALLPPLADAVGSGVSHQRIAVAMGATFQAFQLCCGSSERRNTVTREEAADLGDAMRWLRAALEELHHRRQIEARGDALFRYAMGRYVFDNTALHGKPH